MEFKIDRNEFVHNADYRIEKSHFIHDEIERNPHNLNRFFLYELLTDEKSAVLKLTLKTRQEVELPENKFYRQNLQSSNVMLGVVDYWADWTTYYSILTGIFRLERSYLPNSKQ